MAQVKIYGLKHHLTENRTKLSDLIHGGLVGTLGLPVEKRFQRFLPMEPEDFVFPADRTERYTLIEISMFEGRSEATLKALLRTLMTDIKAGLALHPNDLEITIFASPRHCWGIRGTTGDALALNYKVSV